MPATISMRGCAAGVAAAGWGTGGHRGAAAAASLASSGSRTRPVALDIAPSVWLNSGAACGGRLWRPPGRAELQTLLQLRKVRLRWRLVLHIAVAPGARPSPGPPTRAPTLPLRLQPEPGVAKVVVYPGKIAPPKSPPGTVILSATYITRDTAPRTPCRGAVRRALMSGGRVPRPWRPTRDV